MKKKEMIELLEQRIDQMENEHMQLTRELAKLQGRLDTFESRLPDEETIEKYISLISKIPERHYWQSLFSYHFILLYL